MARRRHRSSIGKDGYGAKTEGVKKEQTINKAAETEKRVESSAKLCSVLHGIRIHSPDPHRRVRKSIGLRSSSQKHRNFRNLVQGTETAVNASTGEERSTSESSDNSDEVVHDSQEGLNEESDSEEDEEDEELLMEPIQIVHLFENLSGEKCKFPEKSKSALRNEYRKFFCIGTLCEKLSDIMSTRLSTAQQLRAQRIESVQQIKSLLLRLESINLSNLAMEKYFSFDDTAQRDALEIMNIRYEELSADIFAADNGFSTLFDNDMNDVELEDQMLPMSRSTLLHGAIEANYANVCSQSKLTEVGLHYVDQVCEMIKRSTAEMEECLAQIAEKNYQMSALASQQKSIHDNLESLASVVDCVIGVNYSEHSKTFFSKTRSA